MEFLSPIAFVSALLLPLLLLPYLIQGRPRRVIFSSLLFLKESAARSAGRRWGRLILPPLFFLQLLLLALLVLALAEPVLSVRPSKVAVIIDNSASMQAVSENRRRFDIARAEAREWINRLSGRARIDVYRTVPRLERVGEKDLSPGEAAALIAGMAPYDLPDASPDYGSELTRLGQNGGYEQLVSWSDRGATGTSGAVKVVSVGRPDENLALTSFSLSRRSFASSQWSAEVALSNFSARDRTVKLALRAGDELLASRTVAAAAGKTAEMTFEPLPLRKHYVAEIEEKDALALDNRRFAAPQLSPALRILAVSPRPETLQSLRAVPGLMIDVISPDAYGKARRGEYALEIFHYATPPVLPDTHALFILPPEANPLVAVGATLSRPSISGWREPHRLTRYVNFTLFRPAYARVLRPRSFGDSLIESPDGPLAIASERGEFRYLALGFDLFPYLGRKNLPVSILTLNMLEWFYEGLGKTSASTGEPLRVAESVPGTFVVTPGGEKFDLGQNSNLFPNTFFQGIYQVRRGEQVELRAFNLATSGESDLSRPGQIRLAKEPRLSLERLSLLPLWPYLLLFSLLLLFLEWFLNPPALSRRR